jgi:hypothetical protein
MSNKCPGSAPHGRKGADGKCLECRRLRAILQRDRERKNVYSPRGISKTREISLALSTWGLPTPMKTNASHFAPGEPRASALGRMGARVSSWRFGINGTSPRPRGLK